MTVQGSVLLVDSSPQPSGQIESLLRESTQSALLAVRRVQSVDAALRMLDAEPDIGVVLLDFGMPEGQGPDALAALSTHAGAVPVIVLLEPEHADLGLNAVLAGAQDYLVKGSIDAGVVQRSMLYARHRKQVELALVERSMHDALTGLPRRRLLLDRLGVAMKRCARDGSSGTVLFIDLDQFSTINQLHGRVVGDAVLRAVGQRLKALLRDSDTVARLGGDEFVVLLPNESRVLEALAVGEKVLDATERPLIVAGVELQISASVGVARFRDATEAPELVVQRADQAMCAARKEGKQGKARVRML